MFFPDVPPAINYAFVLGITCLTVFCNFTKSSSEFSGYLSKVLRNYTEQAGDGDFLSVRCPPRTTITIQSAFYGRSGPFHPQQGPSYHRPALLGTLPLEDDLHCYMSTALQKMLDECQDRRSCKVLVNSRLFGMDPCPSSSKHLIVWYKCRPNEYKSKVACEEERMKLTCKRGMQIAVYSAMFGRTQQGTLECPTHHRRASSVDCQSGVALQVLMTRCQGKRSCFVRASTQEFGDPCYSGTRKYLSVIYGCDPSRALREGRGKNEHSRTQRETYYLGPGGFSTQSCVFPKKLLLQEPNPRVAVYPPSPSAHDPNVVGDSAPPDWTSVITSESLLSDHPERAALYFVCGVCLGLFLTLFALVVQISCRTDCQPRRRCPGTTTKNRLRPTDSSSDSSDSDSDWETTSDLSARRHRRFERTLNMNVFTSAEELERAQRLEERERIIREIWMNGQPDIPGTRSLNRYY
uniref:Protein eva-1 homolog C-like n=1 Tax=Salmo trutta TaxID=8032 RepID=A0A674E366_SALTR